MKARVRCLTTDISVYEYGITMMIQLIDEIALYLESVVYQGISISQVLCAIPDGTMIRTVKNQENNEILLEKQCLFVANKIDLV
jgi:hypothetical protein